MNYAQIILIKYPGIKPFTNFQLMIDNNEISVFFWNWPEPKPTIIELEDYTKTDEYRKRLTLVESLKYRQLRAADYVSELSPEGTFQTSVGDLFDALIDAVYHNDFTNLDKMVSVIEDIKQRHPK